MNSRTVKITIVAILLFLVWLVGYEGFWVWTVKNTYVNPDEMLVLIAKTGKDMPSGQIIAEPGQKGVLLEPLGPGRHFINPFLFERQLKKQQAVPANMVGIVTAKFGHNLPTGEFLAGPSERGIQREVLLPGIYRLNPYAYEVKTVSMVEVGPGFVGVVTSRSGKTAKSQLADPDERGVQKAVLPPGLYAINPEAYSIEHVEIGYNQVTMSHSAAAVKAVGDTTGSRLAAAIGAGGSSSPSSSSTLGVLPAVTFPSSDGFDILLDVTVLWQLLPQDAPSVYARYGNISRIENNILIPQINSAARIKGSTFGAVDFIVGDKREEFQRGFQNSIETTLHAKSLQVDLALVQDTIVPENISGPVQDAKIANEWNLANVERTKTEAKKAELDEMIGRIEQAKQVVEFETQRLEGNLGAQQQKAEQEIQAQARLLVADLNQQTAAVRADIKRKIASANGDVTQMTGAAAGEGYAQLVSAAGGAADYAAYTFAQNLPVQLKLSYIVAGPGTLWTDLKNANQVAPLGVLKQQEGK